MAKGFFTVTLQTKPYLKKYMQTLYGVAADRVEKEPQLLFTTKNYFGMSVASLLTRPINFQHKKEVLRQRTDVYSSEVEIKCPRWFLTEGKFGYDISDKKTISLNKLFETRFEEDLYKFVLMLNICGVETKDALEEFCNSHNIVIDEDITLDAIRKKEFRFRKKMQTMSAQLSHNKFYSFKAETA